MEAAAQSEPLNQEGLAAFGQRAGDAIPVTMLNLLAFRAEGGRERYEEYGAAVTPLLEKVGGRVVLLGEAASPLIGDEAWDLVLLVEYPSRQAFLDMVASPEYRAIEHLRSEALSRSELHPLDQPA